MPVGENDIYSFVFISEEDKSTDIIKKMDFNGFHINGISFNNGIFYHTYRA